MNEEMYKNLIQAARDAIIVSDMNGRIIIFNKAAEGMFGYSANDVVGEVDAYIFIAIIRDVTKKKKTSAELRERLEELEKFHRLTVDRELRIVELKKEIASLKEKIGQI